MESPGGTPFSLGLNILCPGVDKTFTLLLPKILLNEIKLHIEIPKTKFWSQAAFSNQNWDTMECPASNGSECTWSCTIYFQKVFLTSDDSARKGNIKDLGKVTILFYNPRLGWGWGALKIFLRKNKNWTYFECLVRLCGEKYYIWDLLRRKIFALCNNKALLSQLICALTRGGLKIPITTVSHLIINSPCSLEIFCIKGMINL